MAGSTGQSRARARAIKLAALASLATLAGCGGEHHAEVLVVANARSPVSLAIARSYLQRRGIPERNLIELEIEVDDPTLRGDGHETVSRARYEEQVRDPIARHLEEHELADAIEIIVTTKGVPLRIDGPEAPLATWLRDSEQASVDAELALLFSGLDGERGVRGTVNPWFDGAGSFREFRRKRRDGGAAVPRYLVARLTSYGAPLDGESGAPADVQALLDSAQAAPEPRARWLVDEDPSLAPSLDAANEVLLRATARSLVELELDVIHDRAEEFHADAEAIVGYASWGSNDGHDPGAPYYGEIGGRLFPGRFAPRAIAANFVSTNARSFSTAPDYGQSLLADLVRAGVAGAGGHVWEPTLAGIHRPHVMLRRYAQGELAVEAFYKSLPYLGWMNVYVGDPLMTTGTPARATGDRDGDEVPDTDDNCVALPNPDQRDTDEDGYGNLCDGDVDGDGIVTTSWGEIYPLSLRGDVEWIALSVRGGVYEPDHDLDGDGAVDRRDLSIAQLGLFMPPGPSGIEAR